MDPRIGAAGKDMRGTPRLLFVVNDFGFFLSHRLAIGLAARRAGYDVAVAAPAGTGAERLAPHGLPVRPLAMDPHGMNPVGEARAVAELVGLFRRTRPDIVHLVTVKPVLYGGLAARMADVPAVVSAMSGLGYLFIGSSPRGRMLARLVRPFYRAALAHPRQRVIFQNEADREAVAAIGARLGGRAVMIPGSGVDLAAFRPAAEPEGPVTVVMPARLLLDKGLGEFVAAARQLRDAGVAARFVAVGGHPARNPAAVPAATLAAWRAEGAVEFPGHAEDMATVYRDAHLVVLPSYREGFPRVLMEAAASGRAVVATDVPGCRDAVIPGETALLVPPRDAGALAAAMRRLIEDATLRQRMGAAGRRLAEAHFGVERVVERHLALYEELLRDAGRL